MHNSRILRLACALASCVVFAAQGCEQFQSQSDDDDDTRDASASSDATVSSSGGAATPGSSSSGDGGGPGASSSSSSSSSSGGGVVLTEWEQAVLDGLNEVRANASPAPSPPLRPLVWNTNVAGVMRTWAAECVFEKPPVETSAKIGAGGPPQSAEEVVVRTTDSNFDYAANTCTTGSCFSHRAVLSRVVTSVGCAIQDCTGNPPPAGPAGGEWEMWGCTFDPANNPSERPY